MVLQGLTGLAAVSAISYGWQVDLLILVRLSLVLEGHLLRGWSRMASAETARLSPHHVVSHAPTG